MKIKPETKERIIVSMNYDFETLVKRRPSSNLKLRTTPREILDAGNISFDGAEPDFPTAPVIAEAIHNLAENGLYGFTLCDDEYREHVRWWMQHSRNTQIQPEWVIPALGTIYSVATAIRLCTQEGDGVIVTTPGYHRYQQAVVRLNRKTEECPLAVNHGRYHMDFTALEAVMSRPENRLFILCNPQNPIGQIWSVEELTELVRLAEKYGVFVFSDEIFADNCYGGRKCPCYLDIPGAENHGMVCVSLGKSFHFTGVNHANVIIKNEELRKRFLDRRTRDHYGSIDPLAYESILAAYTQEGLDWLHAANQYVEENMKLIRDFFGQYLPDVSVYGGEGGYILWMDFRKMFESEEELEEFLYKKAFFHVGMGSEYGEERFVRMCVASPRWCIEKALGTLKKALEDFFVKADTFS
jgi:cystathionine beta-lyase